VTTVPTVDELKAQASAVRAYWLSVPPGSRAVLGRGVSEPGAELLKMIEGLPANVVFASTDVLEHVVSRELVERAYQVLNDGPGSAGIHAALLLLREALG